MIESKLISAKRAIEAELKRYPRDPKRKQFLLARLLLIEKDIRAMGFTSQDLERNEFAGAGTNNIRTVESTQYLVGVPEWYNQSNNA